MKIIKMGFGDVEKLSLVNEIIGDHQIAIKRALRKRFKNREVSKIMSDINNALNDLADERLAQRTELEEIVSPENLEELFEQLKKRL